MKNPHEILLDNEISKMRESAAEEQKRKRKERLERESSLSIWPPALGILFCTGVSAFLYIDLKMPNIQPIDFAFFGLQLLFLGMMISNASRRKKALLERIKISAPSKKEFKNSTTENLALHEQKQ